MAIEHYFCTRCQYHIEITRFKRRKKNHKKTMYCVPCKKDTVFKLSI